MVYIIVELRGQDQVLADDTFYQSYEEATSSSRYNPRIHFVVPLYPN